MVSIYGGSGGGGFDYVQDPQPQDPQEGEEWYDTGSDSAFVYDGSAWVEQTITDHSKLSGISSSDHHSRYTDAEAAAAAPVAGIRGGFDSTNVSGDGDTATLSIGNAVPWRLYIFVNSGGSYNGETRTTATLYYENGGSNSYYVNILGGQMGSSSNTYTAPMWGEFEQGKRIDRIECSFTQDPSDSDAYGSVEFHYLEWF
ncbi:hypothetical protein [Halolamina salina]|uniref:Uncharacterized protein n=1 Tax=Halolamina salina TaxID=1220023 RepID=A0ABD6B9U8_9EURY